MKKTRISKGEYNELREYLFRLEVLFTLLSTMFCKNDQQTYADFFESQADAAKHFSLFSRRAEDDFDEIFCQNQVETRDASGEKSQGF